MFHSIVNDLYKDEPERISIFRYYVEGHTEVDGDQHSQLALQMTSNLCGNNESLWQDAEREVLQSLQKRIDLWDGVYHHIISARDIDPDQQAVQL